MRVLLAALALSLLSTSALADTAWVYQGKSLSDPTMVTFPNPDGNSTLIPNPCGCALTGFVTLDAQNMPVLWDFTEGGTTLTNLNSSMYLVINPIVGPSYPLFHWWEMTVTGKTNGEMLVSEFTGSEGEATDSGPTLFVEGSKGVWTESVATPEPGMLALIGVGLVGLIAGKRFQSRRNQVPEAVWEPLA